MADPSRTAPAIEDEELSLVKLRRETVDPRVSLPVEEIALPDRKTSREESVPPILVVARTERQLPNAPDDSTEQLIMMTHTLRKLASTGCCLKSLSPRRRTHLRQLT